MILIFGKTLVYWTGILTGILFLFSFFGCCCHFNLKVKKINAINRAIDFVRKYHRVIVFLAFIFFLIHAGLAILAGFGVLI